ncbi:stage IV sporulation protein A, partial [candidate division NPL-UPA2 bacterium]|nr:stage IV sporulation protein A [candidate division NPL-UPA2 bacterium]
MKFDLFEDIVERTGGDVYLGVVGPVRTGKSTFIKKFMELLVIPNIVDSSDRERAIDELPQSSAGKTIMTTEPKFVPDDAIEIVIQENIKMRVRLVDCVGYAVPGVIGYDDDDGPRMVSTPWFDYDISFEEAAVVGTKKVITDHSTIGVVVITDGSFTELSREDYLPAEEEVIEELESLGKPFVIILNTMQPHAEETIALQDTLTEKYGAPILPLDCLNLLEEDISFLMQEILYEFPVREVNIKLPAWVEELEMEHWLRKDFNRVIRENIENIYKLRDIDNVVAGLNSFDFVEEALLRDMDLGTGHALISITSPADLYNRILGEICGCDVSERASLLGVLKDFSSAKKEYDKIAEALDQVEESGYGMVPPLLEEMALEKPEIVKKGGRFGVKLRASAPSLHLIKVNVKSEFFPVIGTEKQSEDLANYIMDEFEDNPEKIWDSNIFGKSLSEVVEVVKDGIGNKLTNMPPSAQEKLQETLEKIINEGSGGLIAII